MHWRTLSCIDEATAFQKENSAAGVRYFEFQGLRSFCLLHAVPKNGEAATHHGLRLQAVQCKQHNPSWSASEIVKHIGCSTKSVNRWVK